RKETFRQVSFMDIDTKVLNKILANQIQQYMRRILYQAQEGFIPHMQERFNVRKPISDVCHFNKLKKKNCIIISEDGERAFDKTHRLFITKTFSNVEIKGT
ncbi:LORF2 protein, partial [Crocuta crocuta]